MPDVSAYPLLRPKRKRARLHVPRPSQQQIRLGAVLLLAVALLAALLWASRTPPQDAKAALAEAQATLQAGNYSAARNNARRAIEADQRSAAAHLVLARALLELGEGAAAEGELGRVRDLGASVPRVLTAQARLLQGDAAGALQAAQGADAVRVRAEALAAQGQGAAAQALLEDRVRAQPRDAAAWTSLGQVRLAAGEMGGATDAADMAARLAPGEPRALTLRGEVIRAQFGLLAALPWFEAALRRDAYYPPTLIEQAATLGEAGRYTEALAATRKALLAKPGSAPALYLQAVIAARAGKVELARRLLAATGGALEGTPGVLLLRGSLDAATGRGEEAVTRWRRLVAAQPMNVAGRRLLGAALLRSGDPRGALDVLRPLALRGDADGYTLTLVARAWEAAGERGEAAVFLDRAAAGAQGAAGLFAPDESLAALVAGAATAPEDPTYALGVIRGLMTSGDRAGALARAQALAASAPRDPAALLAWGDTLSAAGRHVEAATAFERAADLQFDEPTALRLVDALGRAGKPADAAAALALYLGQNPQSLTGRKLLGRWQVASGRWAAAIETLEGVRQRVGNRDAGLLADLALAYAGDGDGAVARLYGRAAYRLQPMNAGVADAYGVALAEAGEVAGARQLLDKALALAPGHPVYLAHRRRLG
ncbi:tetratricopeptide repeat protein [Sphingomonas sp.]|jgi:predicted Zn-dependent protease|uniref:tetratricopeptide repeat protein n=1 Tax=Sphingomonas sp. TaxID=28214 RepID=UPI002D804AFA|nr:tetratricopeptide repeat protein [Sphingomonas sp.]HEU0045953.1 tetratricopeptide repeat protein [Sphingomonas sp.]